MEIAEDKRITKTRKYLGEAIVKLIIDKGYHNVSIQEITQEADVGYRTFFRHFADKEELLMYTLQNTAQEINTLLLPPSAEKTDTYNSTVMFQYVEEHQDIFKVLMQTRHSVDVLRITRERALKDFSIILDDSSESPRVDLAANHAINSLFNLVEWWLNSGLPYSTQKMGELYSHMVLDPLKKEAQKLNTAVDAG